jgi:hypothetical protein
MLPQSYIELRAGASISVIGAQVTSFDSAQTVSLYKGAFEESILAQRIRGFLLAALDQAQCTVPLASDLNVTWLTVEEGDFK